MKLLLPVLLLFSANVFADEVAEFIFDQNIVVCHNSDAGIFCSSVNNSRQNLIIPLVCETENYCGGEVTKSLSGGNYIIDSKIRVQKSRDIGKFCSDDNTKLFYDFSTVFEIRDTRKNNEVVHTTRAFSISCTPTVPTSGTTEYMNPDTEERTEFSSHIRTGTITNR